MKKYYEVTLTDGRVLDFDKQCDWIDTDDVHYVILSHCIEGDPGVRIILGWISHAAVVSIILKEV